MGKLWGCRKCDYDLCNQCFRQQCAQSPEGGSEPQPNLLVRPVQAGDKPGDGKLVIRFEDLLKSTLETCLRTLVLDEPTKLSVGGVVDTVKERADTIINEGAGKGPSGKCPFSSAYEVHIFYKFCLSYLGVWSAHKTGEDDEVDAAFYSQLATICEILKKLDTEAVFLPEEIDQNIHQLKREALWPNWFDGEMKKGEVAARRCLAIGKEWKLEETERYQNALAKLEGNLQSNVQN